MTIVYIHPFIHSPMQTRSTLLLIPLLSLIPPNQPTQNNQQLDPSREIERTRKTQRAARKRPAQQRAANVRQQTTHSAIPLHIPHQARSKQSRIRRQIVVERRQHNSRKGIIPQHTAGDDFARGLETQQADRHEVHAWEPDVSRHAHESGGLAWSGGRFARGARVH
jgi:hypothetical protein